MLVTKQWSGRAIRMPGIYAGIPLGKYHSAEICIEPSISSSGLRTIFNRSERHYWAESPYNPKRIEPDEKEAFILGRAAHHLLFGEAGFAKQFIVRPERLGGERWHGNRTDCKLWLADKEQKGLTVLTPAQVDVIHGIAEALMEEPLVKAGILNGEIERSWFWKDVETGVWLRSRPDASPNDSLDFADLKLTRSVMPHDLQRTIGEYGYFQQAGLLDELCRNLMGKPINSFSLVFVENKAPYCVQIVTLKEGDIERGTKANRAALRRFAACLTSKQWPGPGAGQQDARYIELRDFDRKRIDARIEEMQS